MNEHTSGRQTVGLFRDWFRKSVVRNSFVFAKIINKIMDVEQGTENYYETFSAISVGTRTSDGMLLDISIIPGPLRAKD